MGVPLEIIEVEEIIIKQHDSTYPRLSPPSFVTTPNGGLYVSWSYIDPGGEQHLTKWGKFSDDCGKTWGSQFETEVHGPYLVSGNKVFCFLIKVTGTWPTGTCYYYYRVSMDNCLTWGPEQGPLSTAYQWMPSGTCPIKTRSGVLLLGASWYWKYNPGHYAWRAGVYRSFDDGQTWSIGGQVPDIPESLEGADEPAIVELSNGSIYMVVRTYCEYTEDRRHYASISNDYGNTWSVPKKLEDIHSCNTMACLKRLSWDPNVVVLVWIDKTVGEGNRRPVAAAISYDDCQTWTDKMVLDPVIGQSAHDFTMEITADNAVLVGYRRYDDPGSNDDAVSRRFRLDIVPPPNGDGNGEPPGPDNPEIGLDDPLVRGVMVVIGVVLSIYAIGLQKKFLRH